MIYFVRNDPEVGPASYGQWLAESGIDYQLVRLDEGQELPSLGSGDGAIILGGRMSADDIAGYPFLGTLVDWMRGNAVAGQVQLGICLGGQLLALAAGGQLHRNRCQEIGVTMIELTAAGAADELFRGLGAPGDSFASFLWHHDSFELPAAIPGLARSSGCPQQAFRWFNSWGLQFHPEADLTTVDRWIAGSDEQGRLGVAGEAILAELTTQLAEHTRSARVLFGNFLATVAGTAGLADTGEV